MSERSRLIAAMVAVVMVLALLAGCGGKTQTGGQTPAQPEKKKDPVEINLWAYEPDNPTAKKTLEEVVENWNKNNPDIKLVLAAIPRDSWTQKLDTAIAGKVAPDISYLDQPLVPKWAKEGTLLDLTPYATGTEGIKKDEYVQGALNTNMVGGKLYGLPMSMTAVALFYNKDLVPTPPTTWDEWIAMAQKVYVKDKVSAFEGPWGGGWGAWLFPAFAGTAGCMMSSADNTKVTFNDAGCVDAVKLLATLNKYNDKAVIESQDAFGVGKVATKVSGPWDVAHYKQNFPKLNFGVALIPKKTQYASNIGGENLVIYKTTKNPEAAWKVLKYLTNDENALKFATVTGNFPIRNKAAQDAKFMGDPHLKVFVEQMKYALARPQIDEWLKINDEVLGAVLDEMYWKGKDPKTVLDEAAGKANQLIKK